MPEPKGYKVMPSSRRAITNFAWRVRSELNVALSKRIDVIQIIESVLPVLFKNVGFWGIEVVPDSEMGSVYAETKIEADSIYIRVAVSVYERASNGAARDLFTLAHEIGHFLLHRSVAFERNSNDGKHSYYEDSEWQANVFAGEFLAPSCALNGLSVEEIASHYGISSTAARIQNEQFLKNTKGNRASTRSPF